MPPGWGCRTGSGVAQRDGTLAPRKPKSASRVGDPRKGEMALLRGGCTRCAMDSGQADDAGSFGKNLVKIFVQMRKTKIESKWTFCTRVMRNTPDRTGGSICKCTAGTRGNRPLPPGVGSEPPVSGWDWRETTQCQPVWPRAIPDSSGCGMRGLRAFCNPFVTRTK